MGIKRGPQVLDLSVAFGGKKRPLSAGELAISILPFIEQQHVRSARIDRFTIITLNPVGLESVILVNIIGFML